jgi:hypothetical protein
MSRRWLLALLLATVTVVSPGRAADQAGEQTSEPWPERYFNPRPAEGDIVLPMPCGGAMAFRRVEVPSDGWLGDRKLVLGGVDERFDFSESSRYEYLSGAFSDPDNPARRFYYLGKYEVMQIQVDALGESCPETRQKGRLPATGASWFDAVSFAQRYSEWLYANAPDDLPREGGSPGFLRLPTEAEWEYAARGGTHVPESAFVEPVFPMPDGVHKYVWFEGPRSANGRLQLTGLLLPNPLGLHDMLGNVDEIVLDPYRLNKLSRLHGQPGGFVVKGGNYLTSVGDIRASYRQEQAHFTEAGPNRVATVGFRLAVSAPVLASRERLQGIKQAWHDLPASIAVTSGTEALEDPVAELNVVTQATTDPDLRKRLERLALVLKSSIASRNEQRDRAARGVVRLGAFLAGKIRDDLKRVAAIRRILKGREEAGSEEALLKKTRESLETSEAILEENFAYYADNVVLSVRDYPAEVLEAQASALVVEFENQGLVGLSPLARLYVDHTGRYRESQSVNRKAWLVGIASR